MAWLFPGIFRYLTIAKASIQHANCCWFFVARVVGAELMFIIWDRG
ncbi:hypothetical protein [Sedimenticola selenatireducens]|nr:hypothetical protein [Sedimenticola selenatireducens]